MREGPWCFYRSVAVFLYMKYTRESIDDISNKTKKRDDEKIEYVPNILHYRHKVFEL